MNKEQTKKFGFTVSETKIFHETSLYHLAEAFHMQHLRPIYNEIDWPWFRGQTAAKKKKTHSSVHKCIMFKRSLDAKTLAKLANIDWRTLLFVSESSTIDKKVTSDLRRKQ